MDVDDARTIGARLRQIRNSRKKSLRVVSGLAGISKSKLSLIERGEIALDSRSEIVALANALRIAPSELVKLPIPAPGNGDADSATDAVRLALMAVSRQRPDGRVVTVEELRARAHAIESTDFRSRGVALPGLIRDLHSTLAAGRDVADLLDLAVMVHAMTTHGWLYVVGAPLDLRREAATLAQRMAEERDEPTALGVAAWGAVIEMLAAGAFGLAQDELDSVTVPTNSSESMQLAGMLALSGSLVAAADRRPADADAALEYAAELAQRTGQGNAYLMGFGPTNVGLWRMAAQSSIVTDIPDLPAQTGPPPRERGRIQVQVQSTADNSDHPPLIFTHEPDGSWTIHGLGAPGLTPPADKMITMAESILERARGARRTHGVSCTYWRLTTG